MKNKQRILKPYYCRGCQSRLEKKSRWCSPECRKETLFLQEAFKNNHYAPAKLRMFVLKRDRYRCQYCKREVTYENANIDHVVPWPKGKTVPQNLVSCCQDCNKPKFNHPGLKLGRRRGQLRLRIKKSSMRNKNSIQPYLKTLLVERPELAGFLQQGPSNPPSRNGKGLRQLIEEQIKDMERSGCEYAQIRSIKKVLRQLG
jgi:5-methylcytosine-specific restriction endonuclease McrA